MPPRKALTDTTFKYTDSASTNVGRTIARERRRLADEQKAREQERDQVVVGFKERTR